MRKLLYPVLASFLFFSSSFVLAEIHPYFARCDVNLKNHRPMDRQDLEAEAGHLMRELHFEAAETVGPGYPKYYNMFPDLQWKLEKDSGFQWVDLYARVGRGISDYLKGIRDKNNRRANQIERMRSAGYTEAEISDRIKPLRQVPSATAFSPFSFANARPDLVRSWYRGYDQSARHAYHSAVPLRNYALHLSQPADLATDFDGIFSKFIDLSGSLEIVLSEVLNTPGLLMFNIDESKTTIVDKEGNKISMADYLSRIQGVSLVPWATRESVGAFFLRKESDDFSVPPLRLIFLDASSALPQRVYTL